MIKIAVVNQKGGIGKTTTTVSLAGCLEHNFNKKVLVVDCDPSINSSKYLLTLDEDIPEDDIKLVSIPSLLHVINDKMPVGDVIRQVNQEVRGKLVKTKIFVLPAHKEMEERCNFESDYDLRDALLPVEKDFDFCLFDCPPHLTDMAYEAMACADYILVPAFADTDSLGGFDTLIDLVNTFRSSSINADLRILGILFTNVPSKNALNKYFIESYEDDELVFDTYIRSASVVGQARFFGKPLAYYKPSAPVTLDYKKATKEMLKRISKK